MKSKWDRKGFKYKSREWIAAMLIVESWNRKDIIFYCSGRAVLSLTIANTQGCKVPLNDKALSKEHVNEVRERNTYLNGIFTQCSKTQIVKADDCNEREFTIRPTDVDEFIREDNTDF
ncbi:13200_t:CDS:2 [Rhizophagus irregularis]|nr:hypothetical protein RhiirB3_427612 [Rhizophagus irregularis]CAG8554910.1 13200_t:CDS:2 [Rhizophagus irregularis]